MSLVRYVVRRLLITIPIMFGVLLLSFILSREMPGNPYMAILNPHRTASVMAEYEANIKRLGLDKPISEQFLIYIGDLFTGNWGNSISLNNGEPVWNLIIPRLFRTFEITTYSMIIAIIIGIRAGILSSTHRNKLTDTLIRLFALFGVAIPVFWLGLVLQYIFGFKLHEIGFNLIPVSGYKSSTIGDPPFITGFRMIDSLISGNFTMFLDTFLHLILPVFCLSFVTLASITRQTRSSMLETLELDFIKTARAKGCEEKDIINHHALRNALIPTITVIGIHVGVLLGGAVLVETTFNYLGLGMLLVSAIFTRDYNVLNACVFLITFLFIIVNLITDIIYAFVDPRIRY